MAKQEITADTDRAFDALNDRYSDLLVEVGRLRAENKWLRKQLNVAKSNAGSWKRERDEWRARAEAIEGEGR